MFRMTVKWALTTLFAGAFVIGVAFATGRALDKHELVECQEWVVQAEEYEAWEWADWQIAQCESHGFTINKK